jgi:PAS domain S-box-containing protein/putative nucleotidyltransferase with HDIG domain
MEQVSATGLFAEERRVLLDNMPTLIWQSDAQGHCTYVNAKWRAFTGRSLEQAVDDGRLQAICAEDRDHYLAVYKASCVERQPFEIQYRIRCHDGQSHCIFEMGSPSYDAGGRFSGYVGSCIEITTSQQQDCMELLDSLRNANHSVERAFDETLEVWSRAMDARKKEAEGHTLRVARLTMDVAHLMGMSGEELVHARRGALLHDIGDMRVPDAILLKPGPLLPSERAIMHGHPTYAYEMLYPIEYLRPALDIPYCHHERWDGMGYPRGLKAEQIPLAARVFAVVDVWDVLHSERPYRRAWPDSEVWEYLTEQAGSEFDPAVVQAFCR